MRIRRLHKCRLPFPELYGAHRPNYDILDYPRHVLIARKRSLNGG